MVADGELVKVAVSNKTVFKRYIPDSVKYADAKPSTLAEIGTGDQVRVLGSKDDAGTVQAEQVVSGAFITLAATVVSVDAAAGLVQAKNMQNGKPLTCLLYTSFRRSSNPWLSALITPQRRFKQDPSFPEHLPWIVEAPTRNDQQEKLAQVPA